MADLSLVTDKYFTIASETFTDNLSASIAAGAATVPVNNNSEYTNGDDVVLTVDPGTVNEATFIGRKSGLNFINCVWTEGNTAVGHSNGATIIDYDSATHHNAQTKGIQQFANSNGTLKTQPVRDALGLGATAANGWEVSPYTYSVSTGYNKGNREFDISVASADLSTVYSVGQRLRFTRGTVPGTQCFDAESSSSQYANRVSASLTGTMSTVTDDITVEANVKMESYVNGCIGGRYNGTSGWRFEVQSNGRVWILGNNAGAANYRQVISHQCVPLNEWVHLTGTLDMSGWTTATNAIYMNGISVPVELLSSGTNPTAFVQAGDMQIGAGNTTEFFDGMISDFRMWNVIRTQTQIRDNMYQALIGSETNLIAYWKLAGNFNDSTSAANNLTGQAGAVATTVDHPHQATEYAIITKVVYGAPNTTLTVITSKGGSIPNQTLTAPYYSAQKTPYGFPAARSKWVIETKYKGQVNPGSAATYTQITGRQITVPTGEWEGGFQGSAYMDKGSPPTQGTNWALHTATTAAALANLTLDDFIARHSLDLPSPATNLFMSSQLKVAETPYQATSQTTLYLLFKNDSNGGGGGDVAAQQPTIIRFVSAYV